jgi:transposase
MDEVEQRFVVKYFFIKGWGNKKITAELQATFQDSVLSNSTVKRWVRKFNNGDLFCDDDSRPGDPSQYWDRSCRSFLIDIHFEAPELYQETFVFFLQL